MGIGGARQSRQFPGGLCNYTVKELRTARLKPTGGGISGGQIGNLGVLRRPNGRVDP